MSQPLQDKQTVTSDGESIQQMPFGVTFHDVITQVDERGEFCESFDPRWGWHKDPILSIVSFTIRPGITKGWGLHKVREDRICILFGDVEYVMYDVRPDSPTKGLVAKIVLSERRRRLINIPPNIWHAARNLGNKDVVMLEFPTQLYDHADPDKYRLPLDTDQIPYKFENPRGW